MLSPVYFSGMKYHISELEIELRVTLRELCPGYGEQNAIMVGRLPGDIAVLRRSASFLAGLGLIGMSVASARGLSAPDAPGVPTYIWINSHGENFLRSLEAESQKPLPDRPALQAAKSVAGPILMQVAANLLTAFVQSGIAR